MAVKSEYELQVAALSQTKKKVLDLLVSGFAQASVAAATGLSAGYISQMLADEQFASLVQLGKLQNMQREVGRDEKLDSIQDELVTKLEAGLDLVHKPMEVMRLLESVARIPRKTQAQSKGQVATVVNTVVTLNMPQTAVNMFVQKTANNQVIQAGEQTLVTMQSSEVLNRFGKVANQLQLPEGLAASS